MGPLQRLAIGLEDLERYYRRAQEICGLGPFSYDAKLWRQLDVAAPAIDRRRLRYAFRRYSWRDSNARASDDPSDDEPVLFGTDYRGALSRAPNVLVLLHASLTKIRLDPTGRTVEGYEARSLAGTSARIAARRYVLACGAVENARLLLLSDDVEPDGVGNQHDLVGRFFMEHPDAECGLVQPTGAPLMVQTFRHYRVEGRTVQPGVLLAPEAQAREQVLGCAKGFRQRPDPQDHFVILHGIYRDLAAGRWPDELGPDLAKVVADLDDLTADVYHWLREGRRAAVNRTKQLSITAEVEQAPNPDSRVTLADGQDALGLRQPRLTWRLTPLDKCSLLVFTKVIGAELGRLGLGRVRISDWLLDGGDAWGGDMHGSYHHLGTTRMADDPKRGVVDRHCRVHGIDNLYIAGGSVFATAGPSNPTLTIVALALRLADHLKTRPAHRTGSTRSAAGEAAARSRVGR